MVEDRLTDGVRIAQLLASEITGDRGRLRQLEVTEADPDVVPTTDGAFAFAVVTTTDEAGVAGGPNARGAGDSGQRTGPPDSDGRGYENATSDPEQGDARSPQMAERIAEVYVQPDRVRVAFIIAIDEVAAAADRNGLRVRPKAVQPPRTLVFVEDGAQVKHILPVFEAVLAESSN